MTTPSRILSRWQADLVLLLTAFVWGSGFIAQRIAAPNSSIFFYNGSRFLLGAILLLPLIRFRVTIPAAEQKGVLAAGFLLFGAASLQQAGLRTTSAANAGFITGLYVVFVPIFLWLIWRQRQHWNVWVAAIFAVSGMLLLSANGQLRLASGDLFEFLGAILWALHVIVVGRAVQNLHPLQFAVSQFLICAALEFFNRLSPGTFSHSWASAAVGNDCLQWHCLGCDRLYPAGGRAKTCPPYRRRFDLKHGSRICRLAWLYHLKGKFNFRTGFWLFIGYGCNCAGANSI